MNKLIESIVDIADKCHSLTGNNTVCGKCYISSDNCCKCIFNGFKHTPYISTQRTQIIDTIDTLSNRKQS